MRCRARAMAADDGGCRRLSVQRRLRFASPSEAPACLSPFRESFGSVGVVPRAFRKQRLRMLPLREPFGSAGVVPRAFRKRRRSSASPSETIGLISFRRAREVAVLRHWGAARGGVASRFESRQASLRFSSCREGPFHRFPTDSEMKRPFFFRLGRGRPSLIRLGRQEARRVRSRPEVVAYARKALAAGAFIGEQAYPQRPTTCGFARVRAMTCTFTGSTKA